MKKPVTYTSHDDGHGSPVTYTLYLNGDESPDEIKALLIARRIKTLVARKNENMSDWARDLGVSRQFIYQVVRGRKKTAHVRAYIEERLGRTFWSSGR